MKRCLCCQESATHVSRNSVLRLCDDCYKSMKSDYDKQFKKDIGQSFKDYYKFEKIEKTEK